MKRSEIETWCGADHTTRRIETYSSGILQATIALLIMLVAIPVSAIFIKGAVEILRVSPVAKCEVK